MLHLILLLCFISVCPKAYSQDCPKNWEFFKDSCYKFTRTPLKTRQEAADRCRTYNSDLVAVNTLDEHYFIVNWLRQNDPQHRGWYTSGQDDGDNVWIWDSDLTPFTDVDALFLPMQQNTSYLRYAAYNYSDLAFKWGLQKVDASEILAYICEIPIENLNQLIINERDIDYGIAVLDKDKIPRGPYFVQEPQPVIFDPGSRKLVNDVALKCVAAGYPNPTYKWYREVFDDVELRSHLVDPLSDSRYTQTDGTLIISNPQQNLDRGNYHCTAENMYGVVVSETVQLSFGFISEFNKKRSSDRGRENWGKSLSCDPPQHYPRVNFYWVRNVFPNFVEEDKRVFSSLDGNLYFSSLEKVDAARYSCTVQSVISSSGRTGPFFDFEVEAASSPQKLIFATNFPKAFPDAPLAGDDVRLECIAYGYPVPSYNWTRKGISTELPRGAYTQSYNRVLILPKVRVEDVGDYFCTASNSIESAMKEVPLRIQAKPEFTIPLEHKVVDRGTDVLWTCEAFGKPDVTYQWLKNGKSLMETLDTNDRNRFRIYENILSIDSAEERDAGMYQCKASNHLGSSYSAGQLRVITMKPSFAKYPLDSEMYAAIGGNITIPCRPEAAPFPTFTWKRDNYGLSTSGRIRILANGFLHINPVQREDEGRYTCIAKNQYGSDVSEGLLIVLSLPRMVDSPNPKVKAVVNDSAELPCEAYVGYDNLDLAYLWLQNGLRIDMEKQPKFSVGKLPGYLRIENITLAEAGVYHCIVKTAVGRISKFTELVVFGPPGAPGAVLAEDLTATSGTIHWSDGSANGDQISAYTIEGKTNHNGSWIILKENVEKYGFRKASGRREVNLFNVLSPWSTYSFRVSAINAFGKGEPSDPSPLYNTAMDVPHVAPSNVGGGGGKTGSLTITWDPLPPQEYNAPEVWYNVSYKPANSDTKFQEVSLKNRHNIGLHVVNVGEENFYKPYLVKVQAINILGNGPYSEEKLIYSAENMPQVQPSQVYALAYNSTALNVTWAPLELNREQIRGKLIGYRIKYWEAEKDREEDSLILLKRGLQNWGLIVGLQPNTEYYVKVMAYNDAGSGVESAKFLARTFKAAPLRPPTNVVIEAISHTSVSVAWRGVLPTTDEEPIKGYKVRYWESDQDMTSAKEVERYLDGNDLKVVVSGLTLGKVYKLRVFAFSNGGDGKMSSPVREFKLGDASPMYQTSSSSSCIPPMFLIITFIISIYFSKV